MKLHPIFLSLLMSASVVAADPKPAPAPAPATETETEADPGPPELYEPPSPLTYESIKAWHQKGALKAYIWPKEHLVDLNGDKKPEVLLGIGGYGRGMTYALFTQTDKGWELLSDELEGSHHAPIVQKKTRDGWHDLLMQQPSGRGGLVQCYYHWDKDGYVFEKSDEVSLKDLKKGTK